MVTKVEQAAAVVAAARAAFSDPETLRVATTQDVVDLLALTADLARVVDAQRVRLAGEVEQRSHGRDDDSICRRLGKSTPRAAVAFAFGIRSGDAGDLLRLAAATTASVSLTGQDLAIKFPRVARALDEGEISLAQARAIVTTLEPAAPRADLSQLAWAEGCLVDAATDADGPLVPELLVAQARTYVAVLDPDGVLPNSERQRALRSLRMRRLPDGMWLITLRCPAEAGAAIKALIDAYVGPRVQFAFSDDPCAEDDGADEAQDARSETDVESGGGVESDGGVDVDAAAHAHADQPSVDDRTTEQKGHDVIVGLVRAHAASGDAPTVGGEAPVLMFTGTIDAYDAYLRGAEHPDRALTIEHTRDIVPIETVGRLLCDGFVQHVIQDDRRHPLELGREQRLFSRAQRRALAKRDGGCATPGCGLPVAWTEAHHVVPWQLGGRTDVDNGILLCSHCHHEVHADRLRIIGTPGRWRVVAQLRPSDRYARATRSRTVSAAHAAPAALAMRLPSTAEAGSIAADGTRRAGGDADAPRAASGDADASRRASGDADAPRAASGDAARPMHDRAARRAVATSAATPPRWRPTRSVEAGLRRRLRARPRLRPPGAAIDHRLPPLVVRRP